MRVGSRLLWGVIGLGSIAGCQEGAPPTAPQAPAPTAEVAVPLPPWMDTRTTQWAQRPWAKAEVGAVWRVRHAGREAWLIDAPGHRHDTLVEPDGAVICKPAGFGAIGDGRCPTVADAGTAPRLAWSHPQNPAPVFDPTQPGPQLGAAGAPPPTPRPTRPPLPGWLERQILVWERQEAGDADAISVSRLQHRGATTYLIHAGCCDRYDTLYTEHGRELCSPSGGYEGNGDGRCPKPEDPGTQAVEVWEHPGLSRH